MCPILATPPCEMFFALHSMTHSFFKVQNKKHFARVLREFHGSLTQSFFQRNISRGRVYETFIFQSVKSKRFREGFTGGSWVYHKFKNIFVKFSGRVATPYPKLKLNRILKNTTIYKLFKKQNVFQFLLKMTF